MSQKYNYGEYGGWAELGGGYPLWSFLIHSLTLWMSCVLWRLCLIRNVCISIGKSWRECRRLMRIIFLPSSLRHGSIWQLWVPYSTPHHILYRASRKKCSGAFEINYLVKLLFHVNQIYTHTKLNFFKIVNIYMLNR